MRRGVGVNIIVQSTNEPPSPAVRESLKSGRPLEPAQRVWLSLWHRYVHALPRASPRGRGSRWTTLIFMYLILNSVTHSHVSGFLDFSTYNRAYNVHVLTWFSRETSNDPESSAAGCDSRYCRHAMCARVRTRHRRTLLARLAPRAVALETRTIDRWQPAGRGGRAEGRTMSARYGRAGVPVPGRRVGNAYLITHACLTGRAHTTLSVFTLYTVDAPAPFEGPPSRLNPTDAKSDTRHKTWSMILRQGPSTPNATTCAQPLRRPLRRRALKRFSARRSIALLRATVAPASLASTSFSSMALRVLR